MKIANKLKKAKAILLPAWFCLAAGGAHGQSTNTNTAVALPTAPPPAQAASISSPAGSSTNTSSILAPFQTAEQWLTTFSTNSWSAARGYIQTGAAYQNQIQFADALELGLNVFSSGTNSGLTLSDNLLTAGIAGTIVSDSLDLAWRFDVKDVQIQFGAGPGYDKPNDRLFADIMGELQKKMSANTHAYLRLDLPYEGKSSGLQVILGLGGEF